MWPAYADDGKGYHDGNGKYTCRIPVEDFGEALGDYLGGEVRITMTGGEPSVFRLPPTLPAPKSTLEFHLNTQGRWTGGLGRLTMIDGLEVRAPSGPWGQ